MELFGLPGAGKSTIASRLDLPANAIRREDLASARKALSFRRLARLILETLADWRWLGALALLAIRTPIWHAESLDRLMRLAVIRTRMAAQGGLVVLDQGPLQTVWSIYFIEGVAHPPRRALTRVLKILYADVRVVLVEIVVPPETAAARIMKREGGSSRLDGLPVSTTRNKLQEMGDLPAELLAAARQAGLEVRSLPGEDHLVWLTEQLQVLIDQEETAAAFAPAVSDRAV